MPNIILSENSERLNSLYGKIQAPIAAFLEKRAEAYEQESIARKIFSKRKSTHWAEGYGGLTAADEFEPTAENGDYPTNGFEEGYSKTIQNVTWKSSFAISQELVEDNTIGNLKQKPQSFLSAYYRTEERFFAQMLGSALQGKQKFLRKGVEFDCTSGDGKCVFDTKHKPKVKGADQSNKFSDAFSAAALSKAMTAMQNMKGDNDETLALVPDTIIIPNNADLKQEVFGVIGAMKQPGGGNNDYNYLFGNFTVLVWPYLNDFLGSLTAPWVLMDSGFNENGECAIWQERVPLTIRSELAGNDANVWKGRARFSGGFVDFRGLLACGITGGSTL